MEQIIDEEVLAERLELIDKIVGMVKLREEEHVPTYLNIFIKSVISTLILEYTEEQLEALVELSYDEDTAVFMNNIFEANDPGLFKDLKFYLEGNIEQEVMELLFSGVLEKYLNKVQLINSIIKVLPTYRVFAVCALFTSVDGIPVPPEDGSVEELNAVKHFIGLPVNGEMCSDTLKNLYLNLNNIDG